MEGIKQKIPKRSFTGTVWITNASNKKRLVVDFEKKCAYCDDYDRYSGGYNSYHVEHFAPKEKFKHLEFTYDNLLYSCPYCNISKSDKWIGNTEYEGIVGNIGFVDPCTSEYNQHLGRREDGSIDYITDIGKYMFYEMKLYLKRHMLIYNLEKIRIKREQLKLKIAENQSSGRRDDGIIAIYQQLCVVFCEYYDIFVE